MRKKCCTCKIEKELSSFGNHIKAKDGLTKQCKSCGKEYRAKNKDKKAKYDKEYVSLNMEKINKRSKIYRQINKTILQEKKTFYVNKKEKQDPSFKLARRLRNRIYKVTKGIIKNGSSVKDMGCTVEELRIHIESRFQIGMTWGNWSKHGWHIDHIIPLANFDLSNREEFLKATHYTNLQPLWAEENLKKGKR